jgi:hypothetical protein
MKQLYVHPSLHQIDYRKKKINQLQIHVFINFEYIAQQSILMSFELIFQQGVEY